MNNLARWETSKWNPFKEMEDLHSRLNTIFGVTPVLRGDGRQESLTVTEWVPLVDIAEDENEYVIKAEVPDVRKEDITAKVESGVLTIHGERKFEKEEKGKKYHRIERVYGAFTQNFVLPDDADDAKVDASFKDGVLTVRVAKSEKAKPKAIEVKIG